jgi:hypothetical protein
MAVRPSKGLTYRLAPPLTNTSINHFLDSFRAESL